jgi:hypothetical protein
MNSPKLFMLLLGASPPGRHTEQHDVFFCIGDQLKDLVPDIRSFWPEAGNKIHIDAWRELTRVDGYAITILDRHDRVEDPGPAKLFFLNLGGYKPNEFEEYHYKMIVACADKGKAVQQAYQTAFYKHTGFEGATSHIDDKYGVDVDDVYQITDILSTHLKERFSIRLSVANDKLEDELHLGYFKLDKL